MQPKASRCLLKKAANRMFIQLDLYMPQSDLSPYRDLLAPHLQRRQGLGFARQRRQPCLGGAGGLLGGPAARTETPSPSSFTQNQRALKRFQSTPQPALLRQHSLVRLDIIRKECLSFYFCSFEAPSLRYGPNQGRAIPSTLGSSQAQNLVNPRNRGNQIGLGLLPKPTHSLFFVEDHGGGRDLYGIAPPLLSRSARFLKEIGPKPVYGSVGSLTLRELRSAQILRPTPGSL